MPPARSGSNLRLWCLRGASALLLVALAVAAGGCRRDVAGCGKPGDPEVVACVDGVALSRRFVEEFVEEPWWVPGSPTLPDPRREALDRAVRTHVFAAEARRRGLTLQPGAPNAPASWSQALLADEMTRRGLSREAIPDEEARRHHEANPELFNQIDRIDALVLVLPDGAAGARLYPEAAASEAQFKALVAKHSIDEGTRAKGGERAIFAAPDEDRILLKMALSLRKPGALGGPFLAGDGRWYLLRIQAAPVEHPKPLDSTLLATVKNALVDQRRRDLIRELEGSLRPRARVQIVDAAVARIKAPGASAPAPPPAPPAPASSGR
jgi:hypothetical protein